MVASLATTTPTASPAATATLSRATRHARIAAESVGDVVVEHGTELGQGQAQQVAHTDHRMRNGSLDRPTLSALSALPVAIVGGWRVSLVQAPGRLDRQE